MKFNTPAIARAGSKNRRLRAVLVETMVSTTVRVPPAPALVMVDVSEKTVSVVTIVDVAEEAN